MFRHGVTVLMLGVVVLAGCLKQTPPPASKPSGDGAQSSAPAADATSRKEAKEAHEKAVKALEGLKVDIRPLYSGEAKWLLQFQAKDLTKEGTLKPEVLEQLKKLNEPINLSFFDAPLRDDGLAQLKDILALRVLVINKNSTLTDAGLGKLAGCAGLSRIALLDLKATDAGFAALSKLPRLKSMFLAKIPLTDAGLEHLKALEDLEELTVEGADKLSAAGLVHLKKLPRLKGLTLPSFSKDSKLNDDALKEIGAIEKLEKLVFGVELPISFSPHVTGFGDEGVAHLAGLKNLKLLNLGGCERVTDAGLAKLKGLTNLETLVIGFTKISDDGLANLKEMTKLKNLTLNGLKLTQKGLAHLDGLAKLEWLDLRETGDGVNDAAILRLKEVKSLKDLILYDTAVTKQGADELKKALPDLTISMR